MIIFIFTYSKLETVKDIVKIDSQVYKKEHQISQELTEKRLERNPFTDLMLYEQNELAGYISLYPVPECIFSELCSGQVDEEKVESNVLPYEMGKTYVAYLSSIVINKQAFPYLKGKYLFYSLKRHLLRLKKRGVFLSKMVAYAVSNGGRYILKKMGFKEIRENIFLYEIRGYYSLFMPLIESFSFIQIRVVRYLGSV